MQLTVTWNEKSFTELSGTEVYDMLSLRQQVFVVEQTCAYLDADNNDQTCLHIFARDAHGLVAYARLVPPGQKYVDASIGRVIVAPRGRKHGFGKQLMHECIRRARQRFHSATDDGFAITISAQSYLIKFYQELGFVIIGQEYLEDDIPHTQMRLCA